MLQLHFLSEGEGWVHALCWVASAFPLLPLHVTMLFPLPPGSLPCPVLHFSHWCLQLQSADPLCFFFLDAFFQWGFDSLHCFGRNSFVVFFFLTPFTCLRHLVSFSSHGLLSKGIVALSNTYVLTASSFCYFTKELYGSMSHHGNKWVLLPPSRGSSSVCLFHL